MRRLLLPLTFVALTGLWSAAPAFAAGTTEGLLEDLGDPAAHVRERAATRLRLTEDVPHETLVASLTSASPRARPVLLELIGLRNVREATAEVARLAAESDPLTAEAALRALVLLGPDAVAAGLAKLDADDARWASRRARLRALVAQDSVEQDLLSRWRRKGGTYEGRFDILRQHGWAVQPLLLAMLLDVPLEDRFLAMPENGQMSLVQQFLVLREILRSERRGYRTFRPLRHEIDEESLFDLAAQALMDVGDMAVLGDILELLAKDLDRADERYKFRIGFQLRPFERYQSDTIAEILAAHGQKELLQERVDELEARARRTLRDARFTPPGERAERMQWYATDLSRLAGVLHRMREFERAADVYEESIIISIDLGGSPPAIASYNRACALARAGRTDDALAQLDVALGADVSDLSREWVEEDGDLHSLRADPRFEKILDRAFGE